MAKHGPMISVEIEGMRFNCRAVAVILDREEKRVLLHKADVDDFWALPGGRIEIGETSIEALKREMLEEIPAEVEVERLLWASEEFFEYVNTKWHGIAFYFLARLPADSPMYDLDRWSGLEEFVEDLFVPEHLRGETNRIELIFQWFDRERLHEVTLYPQFLREGLRALPQSTQHVIRQE